MRYFVKCIENNGLKNKDLYLAEAIRKPANIS
jgi:hypothetical protein